MHEPGLADNRTVVPARSQRILTFIRIMAVLSVLFVGVGLSAFERSPIILAGAVAVLGYTALYYLLWRAGYGVAATYACFVFLLAIFGLTIHNSLSGYLLASNVLFVGVIVCGGVVLNTVRGLDILAALSLFAYTALMVYEVMVTPAPLFRDAAPLPFLSTIGVPTAVYVALIAAWVVLRNNVIDIQRSLGALEQARYEAERGAADNAALAAQVQSSNDALRSAETDLRATVSALTLPLLDLGDGVLLLPLVGRLDAERSARLLQELLDGIHARRARRVILDITGLRIVHAQVATTLLEAARAAQLLGAQVVVSGVNATAAQEFVALGASLEGVQTTSSLGAALQSLRAAAPVPLQN